jgi:branched-chain amino acid transport system permease protein
MTRFWKILWGALAVILLLAIPFVADTYVVHVLNQVGIYLILASSLNLVVGYTGQISFAHVGLFAIGAYTSAIMTISAGLSFWVTFPIATVVAGIFGFLIGLPSLRFKTHFFAIVTLGFAEIIRLCVYNLTQLTGGPNGLYNIPFPEGFLGFDFSQRQDFYYLILISAVLIVVIIHRLVRSRFGKAMIAVRENEMFAQFVGIDTWRVKLFAFTVSSLIAGFAGSLYAHYNSYISPYSFTVAHSVTYLLMVIIGGMGTIFGPILGAAFLTILPELLRSIADYRMIIFGALLVLCIMFMPRGLMGFVTDIRQKVKAVRGGVGASQPLASEDARRLEEGEEKGIVGS